MTPITRLFHEGRGGIHQFLQHHLSCRARALGRDFARVFATVPARVFATVPARMFATVPARAFAGVFAALLLAGCSATSSSNVGSRQSEVDAAGASAPKVTLVNSENTAGTKQRTPAQSSASSGNGQTADPDELAKVTASLPDDIRSKILADPADFMKLLEATLAEPRELTLLVDKTHALDEGYVPPDLVKLSGYDLSLNRSTLEFRKTAMPALLEMDAAARRDGVTILLSSTYRSYAEQKYIFAREVKDYGLAQAERESAHPGTSQHQLGTAIDFGSITEAFADTAAGKWLARNAYKYGFLISYPSGYENITGYMYEPWHYRYIGKAAAELGRKYFDGIQQYLLVFLHDLPASFSAGAP